MPEQSWANSSWSTSEALGIESPSEVLESVQQPDPHLLDPPAEPLEPLQGSSAVERGDSQLNRQQESQAPPKKLSQDLHQNSAHVPPFSEQDARDRIYHLEQALEQSLSSLEQFRNQLSEQHLLETQLAATEEVANLQQRALAQLKQQLALAQQALEAQITQAQTKDQTVQELLVTIEAMVKAQQGELEGLRTQMGQDRNAIHTSQKLLEKQLADRQTSLEAQQQRVWELESQILEAQTLAARLEIQLSEAQERIESLYERLSERAYALNQLEDQLQQAHEALEAQQELVTTLRQAQSQVSEQNTTIAALYRQIETLETQLAQQVKIQARLQQACAELSAECDTYQARTAELEPQTATLQEQILMQAQQASEYEAAIQYWKDRYHTSQHQALQLKEVLEQVLPNCPAEVEELLKTIESSASAESSKAAMSPQLNSPQPGKHLHVDLPAFLRKTKGRE